MTRQQQSGILEAMNIIGHRGARALAPENTMAGLEKAIAHGVDILEVDIRQTKDGVLVLHHDQYITDPSGARTDISESNYALLLRHKSDVIALDMAIRNIAHRCPLIIEAKTGVNPKLLADTILFYRRKGWRSSELSVASFEPNILQAIHDLLPDVPLVMNERWSAVRAMYRAKYFDTKRISMNQAFLWRGVLRYMHHRGYKVSPYTVNNIRRAHSWKRYVYGIITDRPDLFKHPKS